jgi:hypothetical protein
MAKSRGKRGRGFEKCKVINARQLAQLRETPRQKVKEKPKASEDQGK